MYMHKILGKLSKKTCLENIPFYFNLNLDITNRPGAASYLYVSFTTVRLFIFPGSLQFSTCNKKKLLHKSAIFIVELNAIIYKAAENLINSNNATKLQSENNICITRQQFSIMSRTKMLNYASFSIMRDSTINAYSKISRI